MISLKDKIDLGISPEQEPIILEQLKILKEDTLDAVSAMASDSNVNIERNTTSDIPPELKRLYGIESVRVPKRSETFQKVPQAGVISDAKIKSATKVSVPLECSTTDLNMCFFQ